MAEQRAMELTFWSQGAEAPNGPELKESCARAAAPGRLPVDPAKRYHAATFHAPVAGTAVFVIRAHRTLRLSLAGVPAADEHLFWRSYQRDMRLAVVAPVAAGDVPLLFDLGPKPRHFESIDRDCPSRNRERVMAAVARNHPDEVECAGWVVPGVALPVLSARFDPAQCVRDGTVWQRVYVRAAGRESPNDIWCWSPAERQPVTLCLTSSVAPGAAFESTPAAEAAAGRRRFFVPVAAVDAPLPPLRASGSETRRVEPELEVAAEAALTVTAAGGSVEIPLPVYESLGRLAPQREFRPAVWPDGAALRAAAPEPILPKAWQHYRELYDFCWEMFLKLVKPSDPLSGLPGPYVRTGMVQFEHHQFLWDSSFTAMCYAYAWRVFPVCATLDLLYSRQFDGGYIHREHDTRDGLPASYEPDFSPNPPILSLAEWALYRLSGNLGRLRRVYPALCAAHAWLQANRCLPDGTYWTTGLANGLDNSPSLGDGYPDLTAQMAHEAEVLGAMAAALGKPEEAAAYRTEYAATAAACNARLWSESMQIYSTSLPGGGHNPNKVVTAFWPLWAGIVPEDRVAALARHLKDPASFWRHHPLPSLAADSPHYQPDGNYWLGSTWAPTNYAAIKGFARAGRTDLAREAALRHLQVMHEVFRATGHVWENYCAERSERGNWSGSDYCWAALGPTALLLEVVLGFEPDAPEGRLDWHLPEEPVGLGVRNYPLGPATVGAELYHEAADGRWHVRLTSDRPFTLRLHWRGKAADHRAAVGSTDFVLDA